jgi:hypothetical protein
MSAEAAGYMELDGAQKDGDCNKVAVPNGLSRDLGCCNEFDPVPKTQKFSCGTCTLVTDEQQPEQGSSINAPLGEPS